MSSSADTGSVAVPSRGNSIRFEDFETVDRDDLDRDLPDHLVPVTGVNHTAYCESCRYFIMVGLDGTEYGHARATNNGPGCVGPRVDCEHRPDGVDPRRTS